VLLLLVNGKAPWLWCLAAATAPIVLSKDVPAANPLLFGFVDLLIQVLDELCKRFILQVWQQQQQRPP
jgi:hypothetical protein